MKRVWLAAVLCVGVLCGAARGADKVAWVGWSDGVFAQAAREHKLVILDLEAVWCHWCHVMEETTYSDREVQKILRENFICVKVDQDARPDLSNRYEDYGWPATVVFRGDGQELVKRQGYIEPGAMVAMLKAVVADPTPGPSIVAEEAVRPGGGGLASDTREALEKRIVGAFDARHGGWGEDEGHRFLDADTVEYCLMKGTPQWREMAIKTLDGSLKINDPVWGGLFQYSTDGDWDHPHFERIMWFQSEGMRIYSRAYLLTGDERYLAAAEGIAQFLNGFLKGSSPAFSTSMDADVVQGEHSASYFALDDAGRRKHGIPRIDRHVYARENGWAVSGLVGLYDATGDRRYLDEAAAVMRWVAANRKMAGGGYRHGEDSQGVYLGDSLGVARGMMDLYTATGDRSWLAGAEGAVEFIGRTFKASVGYATSSGSLGRPEMDENVMLARVANLLWQHTGKKEYREIADGAMRYACSPDVAMRRGWASGNILMADWEMGREPVHVTVVGTKGDAGARELFAVAARWPVTYKRVEWFDRGEGALPRMDVEFPDFPKAAGFTCTGSACSSPAFSAGDLKKRLERATGVKEITMKDER